VIRFTFALDTDLYTCTSHLMTSIGFALTIYTSLAICAFYRSAGFNADVIGRAAKLRTLAGLTTGGRTFIGLALAISADLICRTGL
jgi:hypothetical protein